MIVIGVWMLRRKDKGSQAAEADSPASTSKVCQLWNPQTRNPVPVASAALRVGVLSGFFGIGGGVLVGPGPLFSAGQRVVCVLAGSLLLGAIGAAAVRGSSMVANATPPNGSVAIADDLSHDPNSPVLGNPRGAVTVVEFFDYRCPYCRIMEPRLQELLAQNKS